MASEIVETACAKINLALAVTGRRPDGFHLIDTLAVFADVADMVSVAPAEDLSLEIAGPFADALGDPDQNLVMRAAGALREAAHVPADTPGARIRLEKRLPVASGIGGGSADAAAALRALNRCWTLDLALDRLAEVGLTLGADIPMCLVSRPLRAVGIGEDISPVSNFPSLNLVLANPGVAVSTAAVFSGLDGRFSQAVPVPAGFGTLDAVLAFLFQTVNDLEAPAVRAAPQINQVLNALRTSPKCLFARMSGSGATCFGIYPDTAAAQHAAAALSAERPDWWVRAALTGEA